MASRQADCERSSGGRIEQAVSLVRLEQLGQFLAGAPAVDAQSGRETRRALRPAAPAAAASKLSEAQFSPTRSPLHLRLSHARARSTRVSRSRAISPALRRSPRSTFPAKNRHSTIWAARSLWAASRCRASSSSGQFFGPLVDHDADFIEGHLLLNPAALVCLSSEGVVSQNPAHGSGGGGQKWLRRATRCDRAGSSMRYASWTRAVVSRV